MLAGGAVVVFPSFQLHRVFPVLSGERYSLVVWLHGEDGAGEYWEDATRAYAGGATAPNQGLPCMFTSSPPSLVPPASWVWC